MVLEGLEIERHTIKEQVGDELRVRILSGEIPLSTPVTEEALSRSIGVARSTVREALAQLVAEGLLTRTGPTRVLQVTKLTEDDVRDIYTARKFLELAAVDAAAGASPGLLEELRLAVDGYASAAGSQDRRQLVDADMRCHTALVALLGSRHLVELYAALLAKLRPAQVVAEQPGDSAAFDARHRAFYGFLIGGEIDKARRQLSDRLDAAEDEVAAASRPHP